MQDEAANERQREKIRELHARAVALEAGLSESQRGQGPRWDRIGLVILGFVAIGVAAFLATGSARWAVLVPVVIVPLIGIAGAVVWAFVADAMARRARASEVPIGELHVVIDPEGNWISIDTKARGEAAALLAAYWVDLCAVRYNATNWSPRDPGQHAPGHVERWLVNPNATGASGFAIVDPGRVQSRGASDVGIHLVRQGKRFTTHESQTMGDLVRGDRVNETIAVVLGSLAERAPEAREDFSRLLGAQIAVYREKGRDIKQGRAVEDALGKVPSLASRVALLG